MTAKKGSLVLIKLGDGGLPETFSTIGGLRTSGIKLSNNLIHSSNVSSGNWRQLMDHAGIQSMCITGSGIFTDSVTEETMWGHAIASAIRNYQFLFANGDYVTGPFLISHYERIGDHKDVENYALTLESAGSLIFTSV